MKTNAFPIDFDKIGTLKMIKETKYKANINGTFTQLINKTSLNFSSC